MKATQAVVADLWPLYEEGEASPDTRAFVESFLRQDPEFARRLHSDAGDQFLKPVAVELPADHERATLLRTQRRRALQSIVVNSLALVASAVMTTIYLWRVVPRWTAMFAGVGLALPAATRFTIFVSKWAPVLAGPVAVVAVLLYLYRNRIRVPDVVRSGTALAIATGLALLITQLGSLALMMDSFSVVGDAYNVAGPAVRVNRAMLAMRSSDYPAAIEHLQISVRQLAGSAAPDARLSVSSSLLLGDAYVGIGDKARARQSYEQALRQLRLAQSSGNEIQDLSSLENAVQGAIRSFQ
jgi:hypothetical protein